MNNNLQGDSGQGMGLGGGFNQANDINNTDRIIKLLIERWADVSIKDNNWKKASDLVRKKEYKELLK